MEIEGELHADDDGRDDELAKHRNGITSEHHAQKVIMPPHKRTRRPTRKNDSSDPHAQEGAHLDVRVSSELHARHGDEIDLHANDGGRDEEANNTHMNRDHRRTPRTQGDHDHHTREHDDLLEWGSSNLHAQEGAHSGVRDPTPSELHAQQGHLGRFTYDWWRANGITSEQHAHTRIRTTTQGSSELHADKGHTTKHGLQRTTRRQGAHHEARAPANDTHKEEIRYTPNRHHHRYHQRVAGSE
jgi:hypothetical protein